MPDHNDYVNDGLRGRDDREGFGDDKGTRVGRPDGAYEPSQAGSQGAARPAPLDADGSGSAPGQPGTNASPVADGIEGSIMDEGDQQSRVRSASEGVDAGPAAGDERVTHDL